MLSTKENLYETLKGGHPDRFVNQFGYLKMLPDPIFLGLMGEGDLQPGGTKKTGFGVTMCWAEGTPGPFPMCEGEHKLLKDITEWKNVVKMPPTEYSDEAWAPFVAMADAVDRDKELVTAMVMPGVFEKLHYFMGMEDTMINFYEEPEAMHELIDYFTEYECANAREVCKHMHPEALFHHDDWGSQRSTFLSPDMFEEFIVPAYKKIYGTWKENGVKVIVHHNDAYGATLVPAMIEMGIDVWQGPVKENDLPELIKKYGGQISFHCGLDNGKYDTADWSPEKIEAGLREFFDTVGIKYVIPGFTQGGEGSAFAGAYECATETIDRLSKEYFK